MTKHQDDKKKPEKLGYNIFMIETIWAVGKKRLLGDTVNGNIIGKTNYMTRKRIINYLVIQEKILESDMHNGTNNFKPVIDMSMPCWTKMMKSFCPGLF